MDNNKLMKFRQAALSAGHKASDVDKFVKARQEEMAQENLAREGVLDVGELAKTSPVLASKLAGEGIRPGGKKDEKIEKAEGMLSQLEKLYFKNDDPLAYAQPGVAGGRLPGTVENILRAVKPGETGSKRERLNTYKRTLESKRSLLAKAAGDSGNLALQEQLLAGKGLPDENSTPGEAAELFTASRAAFGMNPSETVEGFKQRKLTTTGGQIAPQTTGGIGKTVVGAGQGLFNFLLGGAKDVGQDITAGITAGKMQKPAEASLQSALAIVSLAEREQDPARKQGLLRQAQDIFSQVGGQQKQIASQFSEDVNMNPLLRGLITGTEVAGTAELAGGAKLLRKAGDKAKEIIKQPFKAKLGKSALKEGLDLAQQGSNLRTAVISKAQATGKKVLGKNVVKDVEAWAVRAKRANPTSSSVKAIDDLVSGISKRISGKKLTAETAKNLWDDAEKGFSAAGTKGSSLEAGYHRTIREALRRELDDIAPGFEKGTKMIKKGLEREELLKTVRTGLERTEIKQGLKSPLAEFLKGTGKGVAGGVATGAGLYTIAKLLGLNISGAFREQQ